MFPKPQSSTTLTGRKKELATCVMDKVTLTCLSWITTACFKSHYPGFIPSNNFAISSMKAFCCSWRAFSASLCMLIPTFLAITASADEHGDIQLHVLAFYTSETRPFAERHDQLNIYPRTEYSRPIARTHAILVAGLFCTAQINLSDRGGRTSQEQLFGGCLSCKLFFSHLPFSTLFQPHRHRQSKCRILVATLLHNRKHHEWPSPYKHSYPTKTSARASVRTILPSIFRRVHEKGSSRSSLQWQRMALSPVGSVDGA